MGRYFAIIVVIFLVAPTVPVMLYADQIFGKHEIAKRDSKPIETASVSREKPRLLSGTEQIRADARGQFVADFRLNGARTAALIDTGATTIAVNRTVARSAGIRVRSDDFIYKIQTANGETKGARATLETVEVGRIRVRDVEALILDDDSLQTVLVGMSFLNKLDSFQQSDGVLTLKR